MKTAFVVCAILSHFFAISQLNLHQISNPGFGLIEAVHFPSDEIGVTIEHSRIHFTVDGGQTWRQRYIPDMIPGAVGVSIHNNDTLFVLAEGKYHRLRYFHGLNGPLYQLHHRPSQLANEQPSIAFNGAKVVVTGNYVDQTTGDPGFYESNDHGSTWNFHLGEDRLFSSVTVRQVDTFLVGRSSPGSASGIGEYWLHNMLYRYPNISSFHDVKRFSCFGNTCIGFRGPKVRVQSGTPLFNDAGVTTISTMSHVADENARIIMNAPDEFMAVYQDPVEKFKFHIAAYRFKWVGTAFSHVEAKAPVLDSMFYSFTDSTATALVPGGICRSDNYIYFTLAPHIYRMDKDDISIEPYKAPGKLSVSLGYTSTGNELVLFGLNDDDFYSYEIYNLSGQEYKEGTLGGQSTLIIRDHEAGMYLLKLTNKGGNSATLKYIKS